MALLGRPDLLVLDEPTVGLDPVLRRDLWELFGRLRDAGASLLVSSHVMDEATRCDRLVLMRAGGILADGTLAELLAHTGTADAEGAFLHLVDEANRALHKEKDSGFVAPPHLFVPTNIDHDGGPNNTYDPENGYQDAYLKIWK